MSTYQDLQKDDELKYVLETYGDVIKENLGDDVGVSFFAGSEQYFDSYKSVKSKVKHDTEKDDFNVTFYNDYTIGEEVVVTDIGVGTIGDYKVIKIVTPFTRTRTYDFIIFNNSEADEVLKLMDERRKHEDFEFKPFPIVGLDFDDIRKNTVDFLLNEDFRDYCKDHFIKLKRGVILEGRPGTGKTLTLQYLKNIALENDIEFHSFKNVDDFVKNQDGYYDDNKKIFAFEDFDTLLRERKDTNYSPNVVLGMILNTLEGVNEINNVVSVFTTNEVQVFDSAFIRPGRIDKVYTYDLPSRKVYREFFEAYIPAEKEYHEHMEEILDASNTDVSFATLKGICDDVNIFKFSGEELTKEKIDGIVKEKLQAANKKKEVKESKDYIL